MYTGMTEMSSEQAITIITVAVIMILGAIVYIKNYIAQEIYKAARLKGYKEKKYFWISFFFATVGCLLVIALPNKK